MSITTQSDAVAPRDASTVILIRDGSAEIEVFLLERVGGMAFAGGMTVFPGGGVDPSDAEADPRWAGPTVQWWADRFGTDTARAQSLVFAAARETFEECGVLLAGDAPATVVRDTSGFFGARAELEGRRYSFSEFLSSRNLVLRADLLRPWSHWITPVGEKRRYDTRFFVAVLPEGQSADGDTSEAASVGWRPISAALQDWRDGKTVLLPPTWSQLHGLSHYSTVAEVLGAEPSIEPIQPDLYRQDGALRVDFPGQELYYSDAEHPWSDR